ncbi:metalloregulator ArsR/SmtB family transcription factor [Paenarthrobacter sp. S56]|uniref:ArsR/SmtB family transcription factor n=1 Tax=Paenarthrobacter sp. S56 TaxID=3138179 RepID=UPI0032199DAE
MNRAPDVLDAAFAALADPTRRAILSILAQGDATVSELAAPFSMSMPAVSKHLKVLEASGLISRTRNAQFRPCHLERASLDTVGDWIEEHRKVWDGRLDRLDQHLKELKHGKAGQDGTQ